MSMTKLFVGNLSFDVTPDDLRVTFEVYGPVSTANVVTDPAYGGSRGFGFIEMARESHATAAIAALDGVALKGRTINVSRARPRAATANRGTPAQGWAVVGDARHRW
jgi:RNA recognition motif-containing protein